MEIALYIAVLRQILTKVHDLSSNNHMNFVQVIGLLELVAISTEKPNFLVRHNCIYSGERCGPRASGIVIRELELLPLKYVKYTFLIHDFSSA